MKKIINMKSNNNIKTINNRLAPFIQGATKMAQFLSNTLTLSNINRFSKFFHYQNQEKICNNIIAKDPTTSQVCRYTTL